MYFCDHCGQRCNNLINVFIVLELCPKCYEKWQKGELGKNENKEEGKNEVENGKERE